MKHQTVKCIQCNEIFGCSTNDILYYCNECSYYNECVRFELSEKLETSHKHICIECTNNHNNQTIQ